VVGAAQATAAAPASHRQFGDGQGVIPAGYSITSSASASNLSGISRPSVFAVLRLITNSNFQSVDVSYFAQTPDGQGRNRRARRVMSVQSRHWLDYDPVALVVLLVGMSAVALLALSI
jgi:hypothetical protein